MSTPSTATVGRALALVLLLASLLALLPGALGPATAPTSVASRVAAAPTSMTAAAGTAVMRAPRLTAPQLTAWFRANAPAHWPYRASIPVDELARLYLEEGRAEGVAGDVAFVQGVLETGWFHWPSTGQVTPTHNNFAGIGACNGGTCTVGRFPDARIGVRAQIHHLRAYADPTVTEARLAHPLESPRFHLVTPKGMASSWEQFGGGVWATDPNYAPKILDLYRSALAHAGVPADAQGGLGASQIFTDVPGGYVHATAIATMADRGVTHGCGDGSRFCPGSSVTRDQMATFLTRALDLPAGRSGTFGDVGGAHAASIDAVAAAGITQGCTADRYCPRQRLTRDQMASLLARALALPAGNHTFRDVPAGHPHGSAIGAIADADITRGCEPDRFCPDQTLTRGQMATFLDDALGRR